MFPPLTSALSLDAYLLRYNHPRLLQIVKKRHSSPSARENRRYRKLIKTFLTTLAAEVLRERLRLAAEEDGKSIQLYLQEHQWNILKATRANQMIIDLVYPRVSESLNLSRWGPLLTCLALKAVKCLSDDEIADVNVIDKMCRKYVTKYKCGWRKRLKQLKQDWGTVCTCSQKLADSAKNAKLIKSVRNFIDEVTLQQESKVKRPYSAPARTPAQTSKEHDSIRSVSIRRPVTTNSACERRSLSCTTDGSQWFDILRQRQLNYRAPKQILIPISLNEISKPDRDIMENINKTVDTENLFNKENPKPIRRNLKKKMGDTKNLERSVREHQLRQLCGRLLLPVQIPRTFIDISPTTRPVRLKPLKKTSMLTTLERGLEPLAVTRMVTKPVTKVGPFPEKARAKADAISDPRQEKTSLLTTSLDKFPRAKSATKDQIRQTQVTTSTIKEPTIKEGFTTKQIKELVKAAITLQHVEDVAADSLFYNRDFINTFFRHLEKTNKTDQFLHVQNFEEHETFQKVDGRKVRFSFLHYCLYKHAENQKPSTDAQEYLLKRVLNALTCNHDVGDDSEICCWKCEQKCLAMELAINMGNTSLYKLLLHDGVLYKEEHLQAAVKVENIAIFKQIIAELKKSKNWNPTSPCVREALYLARFNELKQFVRILQSEGVEDKSKCVACLPCFL